MWQVFATRDGDKSIAEALRLFQAAMQLEPTDDEARAALYNSACCYTKQKRWQPAVDAVVSAVNDYDLKLSVAVKVRYKPLAHVCVETGILSLYRQQWMGT